MKVSYYILFFFLMFSFDSISQVSSVKVVAQGSGVDAKEAIADALKSAVRSRNTVRVGVSSSNTIGVENSSNTGTSYSQSNNERTDISYEGYIKSYKLMSKRFDKISNEYIVKLEVDVLQLQNQLDSNKKTIAVMPVTFKNNVPSAYKNVLIKIHSEIESLFVQSKKFNNLTRGELKNIRKEWNLISSDMVSDIEKIKLKKLSSADYLVVVSLNEYSKNQVFKDNKITGQSEKFINHFVDYSFKIINTISGNIVYSESDSFTIINNEDSVGSRFRDIARKSIFQIYPPMIINKLNEKKFIVNYGSGILKSGSTYNIYSLNEKVTDPYTGEEIGYSEKIIGSGMVVDVKEKYSVIEVTKSFSDVDLYMIIRYENPPAVMKNKKKKKGVTLPF